MSKSGIMTKWPKIFLFGDSLTQYALSRDGGWGSLVGDFFQRRCDVILRGFSGYNTRHCQYVLPKILDETSAKDIVAMTIFLGGNDAAIREKNPTQHVPLEEYKNNLEKLVDYCMSIGISREKIILISPPAFDTAAWTEDCKMKGKVVDRDTATSAQYAVACCKVAKELGVHGIDLSGEMMKSEDFARYLSDGLHLAEEGSQLLFELLKPILEKMTSHIPQLLFPHWSTIDNENPEPFFKDW